MNRHAILPIIFLISFSLSLYPNFLSAQSWSLNINSNPPAELWRWTSGEAQLRLTVTDVGSAGRAEVQVRIRLNGKVVATTGRMPIDLLSSPVVNTFVGFEFISFAGTDFPDPTLRSRVLTTGRLPSGSYQICLVVNGVEQTFDCPDFDILSILPPSPIFPENGDTIGGPLATFEWDPIFPLPLGTIPHYRLVVKEVYRSQSPIDAFHGNGSIYDETFVGLTSIPWPTILGTLRVGAPYVWSVQGLDGEGNPLGEPDGWGEVRTFFYAAADQSFESVAEGASAESLERATPPSDTLLFAPTTKQSGRELSPRPEWVDTVGNIFLARERLDGGDTMAASFYGVVDSIVIADRREVGSTRYWTGRMLGSPESYVIFAGRDDLAVGNILRNDTMYLVRDFGNGVHKLVRVDPSGIPSDSRPIRPELPTDSLPTFNYTNTDPPDRVDVMILYTPQTLARGMSEGLLQLEVELALEEANLSFAESGLDLRLIPRHFDRIEIDESDGIATTLGALRRDEEVAQLRNRHHADLVLLIVDDDGGIPGQSFILPDLHPWYEGYGFAVIGRQGLAIQTLPHEVGHLFGAGHDCLGKTDQTDEGRTGSSRGYLDTVTGRGTMMVRRGEGGERILRWSDPTGEYAGEATGSRDALPCGTCNACTIRDAGVLVANYRSASAHAAGIWLKDTWHDTGEEPGRHDPASGQFAWESPYVWLRDLPDSGGIRLPREPSGVVEGTGYLYVMLHNGGEDTTGILEVWRRPTTVGNGGTGDWKRVDTLSITISPYHTRVLHLRQTVGEDQLWSWLVRAIPSETSSPPVPVEIARTNPIDYALANNNVALSSIDIIPLFGSLTQAERKFGFDLDPSEGEQTLEVRLEELGLDRATLIDEGIEVSIGFDSEESGMTTPFSPEGSLRDESTGMFLMTAPTARFRLPSTESRSRGTITIRVESTGGARGYWRREHAIRIILFDGGRVIDGTTITVRTREGGI